MAYLLQMQALEREVLALQAPSLDRGLPAPSMSEAQAEFDAWLISEPPKGQPVAVERSDLHEVLGVGGGW